MSLLSLPRTYANLTRLRQIAVTLARHGFSHILSRIHLFDYVPGLSRLTLALKGKNADAPGAYRLASAFEDLGATFIKLGQLLANRPDMIPADFVDAFSRLQDSVVPLTYDEIREVIEEGLGGKVEDFFAEITEEPVASGSIGQVHFAVLLDGTEVVVKAKRPGTDKKVRDDLRLLAWIAELVEKHIPELSVLRPRVVVEEFSRAMTRELDFVGEASYAAKFAEHFDDSESVIVPRVYWNYVTHDVLVYSRAKGVPLTELETMTPEYRRETAKVLAECFMKQFFQTGFFHADPHQGNIISVSEGVITLVDYGQMGHLSGDLRQSLSMTLLALARGDVDFIVDVYAELGIFTEKTNIREFRTELVALLNRYYGIPVDRIDISAAFSDAVGLARNHGIRLPAEFIILGKSFVTIFTVIRLLDPNFRLDDAVKPFAKRILGSMIDPRAIGKRLASYMYRVFSIIRRAPEDMRDLLEKAKSGQVRIIFHHEGLDEAAVHVERASNRLTLGVIISAITVGSSIVLAAGRDTMGMVNIPRLGEVPISLVVSGFGFIAAMFMGFWLAISILRSNRF